MNRIALVWKDARSPVRIEVSKGKLAGIRHELRRSLIRVADAHVAPGSDQTILTVRVGQHSFSFFLRDVSRQNPIFLPELGVAVTLAGDHRSFAGISRAIRNRGGKTVCQQIELEPEETFVNAAANTLHAECQTWLGLSRDIRIF